MNAPSPELIHWLKDQLAAAEEALKTREDMARTWRSGSNEAWAAASMLHPSTAGKAPNKATRLFEADKHERIAVRLRREVEMFRATLTALGQERKS